MAGNGSGSSVWACPRATSASEWLHALREWVDNHWEEAFRWHPWPDMDATPYRRLPVARKVQFTAPGSWASRQANNNVLHFVSPQVCLLYGLCLSRALHDDRVHTLLGELAATANDQPTTSVVRHQLSRHQLSGHRHPPQRRAAR